MKWPFVRRRELEQLHSKLDSLKKEISEYQVSSKKQKDEIVRLRKLKQNLESKIKKLSYSEKKDPTFLTPFRLDNVMIPSIPASYSIFKEGSYYFAQPCRSGLERFLGKNASSVIRSTIDSLSNGEKICLKGVFEVDSPIIIDRNNLAFVGEGTSTVLKQKDGANLPQIILVSNAHDVIIQNLKIDGNRANNTSGHGIKIDGESYRGFINNIQVWSCYTGILADYNAYLWNISNCHVEDCYETGIAVENREVPFWRTRVNIRGNKIVKTGHHGILVSGASDSIIAENICYDVGILRTDGYAHGIALDGDEGERPSYNNKVIGNFIYNTRMQGIEVADRQNWVEIIGNHIENVELGGIYFGGGLATSYQAVISGNICRNCGGDGIVIGSPSKTDRSAHVLISDNICFENKGHGIAVGWSSLVRVAGNICFNNDQDDIGKSGILLGECYDADVVGNILFDNQVTPKQDYGVVVYPDTYGICRIIDNKIGAHQHGAIGLAGTGTRIIKRNEGYVTENSGTASGSSPITIPQTTHLLDIDPTYVNAVSKTSGQYVISVSFNPVTKEITIEHSGGASSIDIFWEARA